MLLETCIDMHKYKIEIFFQKYSYQGILCMPNNLRTKKHRHLVIYMEMLQPVGLLSEELMLKKDKIKSFKTFNFVITISYLEL